MKPYYSEAGIEIYHADCREVIPTLGKVDLVLTDPPYGLGDSWKRTYHGPSGTTKLWGDVPDWDEKAEPWVAELLLKLETNLVFWGANNYLMPPSACWFIWDKLQESKRAEFEMAWTTLKCGHKAFRMSSIDANWNCRETSKQHPNEKPLGLMQWCLKWFPKARSVIDPFMGSGTTLVAAKMLGRRAIGIELDERHCETAACRLAQGVLPLHPTTTPKPVEQDLQFA